MEILRYMFTLDFFVYTLIMATIGTLSIKLKEFGKPFLEFTCILIILIVSFFI